MTMAMRMRNWKQDLYAFLMNYRATPHTTTGVSPAEALFGRKLKTRLPQSSVVSDSNLDDQIRLKDTEQKRQMKAYADRTRHERVPDVHVGDRVLVRQPKLNKFTAPYLPETLTVVARKGSMVTAGNNRRSITRNSSFFKKVSIPPTPTPEVQPDDLEAIEDIPAEDEATPMETPTDAPSPKPSPTPSQDVPKEPLAPPGPRRTARIPKPKLIHDV